MTKEEYLELRTKEEAPLSLFYAYWVDKRPAHYKDMTLEQFEQSFSQFLFSTQGFIVNTSAGMQKAINYPSMLDNVYAHFNQKFGV